MTAGVRKPPRVSIVTISFNQREFLERAIRSVVTQDYPDVEYIVVDPGSTDGSREVIEHWRSKLAAVVTDPDDGPADGLNRGFSLASGEIFAYLNADDVLLPGAIPRAVSHLERMPEVDVIYGDGFVIDAAGRPVRRFRSTPFSLRLWLYGGVTIMQQATLVRAPAFRDVGGFNRENRAIWDAELILDLALAGKRFAHVAEDWALFTWHSSSISVSRHSNEQVRKRIEATQERLARKGGARPPGAVRSLLRAEARLEKWARDPVGFVRRLGEVLGRAARLPRSAQLAAAKGPGAGVRPRVALLSHAYLEPQIRKNAHALARLLDLRVLSPARWEVLVFDDVEFAADADEPDLFKTYRPLRLFGAQYVLPTLTMGFRRWKPDVLHVEYDPWNIVFWQALVCRRLFAPEARMVCHAKKNTYRRYEGWRRALKQRLASAGLRRVDRVVAASELAAEIYAEHFGFDRERITVIPHLAVDLATFQPVVHQPARGERALTVGYVGQLADHKGVLDLVDAVRRARQSVELELHLLGRGPLEPVLADLAGRANWLRILAAAPNAVVAEFLAGLDVFVMATRVLPDHEEHDALALVEALASGLPTVGTRSGIIPEILGDGTGLLVEPAAPAQLAEALVRLATDPGLRSDLSRRARWKAEHEYGLEIVAAQKAALLAEVCA